MSAVHLKSRAAFTTLLLLIGAFAVWRLCSIWVPVAGRAESIERARPSAPAVVRPRIPEGAAIESRPAAPDVRREFVVTDEYGSRLAGAEVLLVSSRARRLTPGSFQKVGVADGAGRLVVDTSWREGFVAAASHGGRMSAPAPRPPMNAAEPIALVVARGFDLVVTVLDEFGTPVEGVPVTIGRGAACTPELDSPPCSFGPMAPFAAATVVSDAKGRSRFRGLIEGAWRVTAESLGYVGIGAMAAVVEVSADTKVDFTVRPVWAVVVMFDESTKNAEFRFWADPGLSNPLRRHRRALMKKFPNATIVSAIAPGTDPDDPAEWTPTALLWLESTFDGHEIHELRYRSAVKIDTPHVVAAHDPKDLRPRGRLIVDVATPSGAIQDGIKLEIERTAAERPVRGWIEVESGKPIDAPFGAFEAPRFVEVEFANEGGAPPCELVSDGPLLHGSALTRATLKSTCEFGTAKVEFRAPLDETYFRLFVTAVGGRSKFTGFPSTDEPVVIPASIGPCRLTWGGEYVAAGGIDFDVRPGARSVDLVIELAPEDTRQ